MATEEEQKRLNRLLEEYNRSLEETVKKQDSVSKGMKEEVNLLERKMKLLSLQNKELAAALEFAEKEEKLQQNELKAKDKELKDAIKLGKLSEEEVAQAKAELALKKQINKQGDKAVKQLSKKQKLQASIGKALKEQSKVAKEFRDTLASNLDISTEFSKTMAGGIAAQAGATGNWIKEFSESEEKTKMIGKGLGKTVGGALGFIISEVETSILGIDTLKANLTFATQASDEFAISGAKTFKALRKLTLDSTLAGDAIQSLFENTTMFRRTNDTTRKSLALFTAKMKQAGVDSKITSETFQLLNKTVGLQGEELVNATDQLRKFGQSINVSVSKLLLDMSAAAPVLGFHGKNMVNVFKGLAAQAEATGLEVGDLLSIAGQFDTFDQSAEAVGKLNSILGGPFLNSIDMVYMSEEERIQAMRDSLELSGKSFDSMGRFEKRAFAAAAGITDAAKAQELFGTASEDMAKAAAKAEGDMTEGEKLDDLAKRATTFMDRMRQITKGLLPVFENLDQYLTKIEGMFETFTTQFIPQVKEGLKLLLSILRKIEPILSDPAIQTAMNFRRTGAIERSVESAAAKQAAGIELSEAETSAMGFRQARGGGAEAPNTLFDLTFRDYFDQIGSSLNIPLLRRSPQKPVEMATGTTTPAFTARTLVDFAQQMINSGGSNTQTSQPVEITLNLDGKKVTDVVIDHMTQRAVERP